MEGIGARVTLFELDGFGIDRKNYPHWLLAQVTASRTKVVQRLLIFSVYVVP
jgi:hypothetical protein